MIPNSFSDSVCNSRGEVRLNMVRGAIDYDRDDDVEYLKSLYREWVQHDEFLVLKLTEDMPNFHKDKWIAVKCSKRGNDVYQYRIERRLKDCLKDMNVKVDKSRGIKKTNALYVTNSYDTKLKLRSAAWVDIGHEWNTFLSGIRKKYGKFKVVRAWETYENGFPHIHAVLVFENKTFETFKWHDKEGKETWRIKTEHKEFIQGCWHSFVDVQGVVDFEKAVENVVWYVLKNKKSDRDYHDVDNWNKKDLLTSAATWFFHKRSFGVSGDFGDLIRQLCIIQTRNSAQCTLYGIKAVVSYEMLGLVPGDLCKIQSAVWFKVFDERPVWLGDVRMPRLSQGSGVPGDWFSS